MPVALFSQWTKRASPNTQDVPIGKLVFYTDVFLLALLGVFILASIPHALARFTQRSEWWRGLAFFKSHRSALPSPPPREDDTSTSSGRTQTASPILSPSKPIISTRASAAPHISSLSARFPTISYFLSSQPVRGYSIHRTFVRLFYFGVLLFPALLRDSVFKNPIREGAIVASQLPWVYALATKNNVIGTLTGYGYEKLNWLHRWVGILLVIAANVHAIGYIYKWVLTSVWTEQLQDPTNRWGLVALVAMDILYVFSLRIIRTSFYGFFLYTHLIALVVLLIALPLHQSFAIPYVAVAAGLYGADRLLRVFKSFTFPSITHHVPGLDVSLPSSKVPSGPVHVAFVTPIPALCSTLVRIPGIGGGWRAGQHVRIRVLTGMGSAIQMAGWAESHPFTIANSCESIDGQNEKQEHGWLEPQSSDEGNGMMLLVKTTGGWTGRLYELACQGPDVEKAGLVHGMDRYDAPIPRKIRLIVDGPYGGPGHTVFSSFTGVLLVIGGSGISFGLAVAHEALRKAVKASQSSREDGAASNTRAIEMVWCVQHEHALSALLPTFADLMQLASKATPRSVSATSSSHSSTSTEPSNTSPFLKIRVFYTRTMTSDNNMSSTAPSVACPSVQSVPEDLEERRPTPVDDGPDRTPGRQCDSGFNLLEGITIHPGRPCIGDILDEFVERAELSLACQQLPGEGPSGQDNEKGKPFNTACRGSGIVVGVCGPQALGQCVRQAVGGHSYTCSSEEQKKRRERKKRVGGVEVFEEAFHW